MTAAKLLRFFDLPLLAKELNEQAAQRRTYVIRFAYASLLFVSACGLFYGNFLKEEGASASGLGHGRVMFETLVGLQFWSIYLLVPAISCGCLTVEKERNSLALLLITSLSPWQIVMQKLLGRVVPMATFVLLSFPLMAVAYSFGGMTEDYLWSGIVLLVLTCFQTAALSVMCSAWFPTTVEAFVANYTLFVVLRYAFPWAWGSWLFHNAAAERPLSETLLWATCGVGLTGVFLLIARMCLVARAFVAPKNALLGMFQRLDAFFNKANSVTGGIVLVKDGDPLPGQEPVAWRETTKKSLGTFRYLFRGLLALELPLLFVLLTLRENARGGPAIGHVSQLLYGLWCLGAAMVVVHAGSVVASERTRQSLDVLLATPMTGAEILRQKLRGVERLIRVLSVPLVTIFAFEVWWHRRSDYRWLYLVFAIGSIAVYLPLVAWLALWIGLKVRSQIKVVLGTMALVAGWLAFPLIVRSIVVERAGSGVPQWVATLMAISPAEQIVAIEGLNRAVSATDKEGGVWQLVSFLGLIVVNFLLHGLLRSLIRRNCLQNADRWLGRLEAPAQSLSSPARSGRTPESLRRATAT